jgi:hypothetical protein
LSLKKNASLTSYAYKGFSSREISHMLQSKQSTGVNHKSEYQVMLLDKVSRNLLYTHNECIVKWCKDVSNSKSMLPFPHSGSKGHIFFLWLSSLSPWWLKKKKTITLVRNLPNTKQSLNVQLLKPRLLMTQHSTFYKFYRNNIVISSKCPSTRFKVHTSN